ncbi:hypothetical protein CVT26_003882, partial [Gymnopilus dilepis]
MIPKPWGPTSKGSSIPREYWAMAMDLDFSYLTLEDFLEADENSFMNGDDTRQTHCGKGILSDTEDMDRVWEELGLPFCVPKGLSTKALQDSRSSTSTPYTSWGGVIFVTSDYRQYALIDSSNAADGGQVRDMILKVVRTVPAWTIPLSLRLTGPSQFNIPPGQQPPIYRMHSLAYDGDGKAEVKD